MGTTEEGKKKAKEHEEGNDVVSKKKMIKTTQKRIIVSENESFVLERFTKKHAKKGKPIHIHNVMYSGDYCGDYLEANGFKLRFHHEVETVIETKNPEDNCILMHGNGDLLQYDKRECVKGDSYYSRRYVGQFKLNRYHGKGVLLEFADLNISRKNQELENDLGSFLGKTKISIKKIKPDNANTEFKGDWKDGYFIQEPKGEKDEKEKESPKNKRKRDQNEDVEEQKRTTKKRKKENEISSSSDDISESESLTSDTASDTSSSSASSFELNENE